MGLKADFDSDIQESQPFPKSPITFVSTVAHRNPSGPVDPLPAIPSKRKNRESSDDTAVSSLNGKGKKPTTPSPSASVKDAIITGNVSVVIPSPSAGQVLKPRVPRGVSEKHYPTRSAEVEKAHKRDYPKLKASSVGRPGVSFSSSLQRPASKAVSNAPAQAVKVLRDKILESLRSSITGPEIIFSINDQQLANLASSFSFVNEYTIREGVTPMDDDHFNVGCDCIGHCDPDTCLCLAKEEGLDKQIVPYHRINHGSHSGKLVLQSSFIKRKSMIYECSYRCACQGTDCWNHVVQNGRQVRLEIFDTGARGCGLRSPDSIIAGQFIDRYLGEVITRTEADSRELADQDGQSYLFGLDFLPSVIDSDESESDDDEFYVIDGQKVGSPTRFMNHSCNPNCKIFPVTTENPADTKLYYLAFFALRDIPAGTELTFDYNPSWDGSKKIDPHAVKCLCGEKKCRGQLWPNARKTS